MTKLRDIHDQHSAEAAEAWALQNFKCALTSLVEQVDFDNEQTFNRFVNITSGLAWINNEEKLAKIKESGAKI